MNFALLATNNWANLSYMGAAGLAGVLWVVRALPTVLFAAIGSTVSGATPIDIWQVRCRPLYGMSGCGFADVMARFTFLSTGISQRQSRMSEYQRYEFVCVDQLLPHLSRQSCAALPRAPQSRHPALSMSLTVGASRRISLSGCSNISVLTSTIPARGIAACFFACPRERLTQKPSALTS